MATTTATEKKITKKDNYNEILALIKLAHENELTTEEKVEQYTAFIEHEIDLISKKSTSNGKPTANQTLNANLCDTLLTRMVDNQIYSATELIKLVPMVDDKTEMTASKMNALLRSMVTVTASGVHNPDGTIERIMEKGKTYFRKL
jgi:hypothetical protein